MVIKLEKEVVFVQSFPFTIMRSLSLRAAIDKNWEEYKIVSNNISDFNGDVIYVTNFSTDNDRYILEIGKGQYSDMIFAKESGKITAHTLFVASFLRTSDGKICFVLDHGDRLNTIGGMADILDMDKGIFKPEKCLARELMEEIGVDIHNKKIFKSVIAKYLNIVGESEQSIPVFPIGILYEITSVLSKEELQIELVNNSYRVEEKEIRPVFMDIEDLYDLSGYTNRVVYIDELCRMILSN